MRKQIWICFNRSGSVRGTSLEAMPDDDEEFGDKWERCVPASELEELKAAILDLEQKMKFGVGHYDDYDDAIELLADKARPVGGNKPGTVRFKYTEKPTQEGES